MNAKAHSIYLAAPFFSQGERLFNDHVVKELETASDVIYPHRDGPRMADLIAQGTSLEAAAHQIWLYDFEEIRNCNLVVAVLDGRVPDEGVCIELGLARGFGKPTIGLLTDARCCFPWGANPMVTACLSAICADTSILVTLVKQCLEADGTSDN